MKRKRGFIILILTQVVLSLSLSVILILFNNSFREYQTINFRANYEKAKFLAQSGVESALLLLNKINLSDLQAFGPPPIPLNNTFIILEIEEISGKLSLNHLIDFFDETRINFKQKDRLARLSNNLTLSEDIWEAVIDWIDKDNHPQPSGFEQQHYDTLNPPRKVKNGWLHSTEELLLIPGFSKLILYEDIRTSEEKNNFEYEVSVEDLKLVIKPEDFILASNLTTILPSDPLSSIADQVNINRAPYNVIMSLSDNMTPEIAIDILKKRLENGKVTLDDLKKYPAIAPELPTSETDTLSNTMGIHFKDYLYQITAYCKVDKQEAKIVIVYDAESKKIIQYRE